MSFGHQIFQTMAGYGNRPALVSDGEQLSYAELTEQAAHLAANFAAQGLGTGDRVAIVLRDPIDTLLCYLACWRLDATPAIFDFRTPRARRQQLASDFAFAAVLEDRAPPGEPDYPFVVFSRDWRFGSAPEFRGNGKIDCSNPATLLFSSGTTGTPKAYVEHHETLLGRLRTMERPSEDLSPRYLTPVPLSFAAARGYVLSVLFVGGVVRFFSPLFTPSDLIEGLLSFKATATSLPPPVIARLVREAGERREVLFPDLVELRSIGGPARPEDKIAAWRNLARGYRISYASTLTGRVSILRGEDILAKPESSGRLLREVSVDILDEDGKVLPVGERGIIKAYTPTIASAVLLPGNKTFVDPKVMGDGWAIPGDIGFLDDDGFLTIVDRQEDMIVRGGVNVAPQEVEKIACAHPKITEAAVVGFPDDALGQEIAIFVVSDSGVTQGEVRAFLATNVPPDKRPREIRISKALPYNNNGKLLRRALVEELERDRQAPASDPQGSLQ